VADYTLQFRDPRTLVLLAQMPFFKSLQWWRRPVKAGAFSISVHKDDVDADILPYFQPGLPEDVVFELLRDNVFEFGGVVEQPEYDAITQMWKLSGPDLKGFWLASREINVDGSDFDTQAGVVAETAMIHYVEDHLTAPSDASRNVNEQLDGITFTARGTQGFGATVDKQARWENLLAVLEELALKGNVLHDVVLKPNGTGYEYQVREPIDATVTSGDTPIVFSVSRDNVGEAVYVRDNRRIANVVYALGSGTGAARTVREVTDAASIAASFRRERHVDARQAEADNDALDMAGDRVIDDSLRAALTARMAPLNLEPTIYPDDFDIGYDVTIDFNVVGVQVDKRIVEIHGILERPR
jgi:hypothetical protein